MLKKDDFVAAGVTDFRFGWGGGACNFVDDYPPDQRVIVEEVVSTYVSSVSRALDEAREFASNRIDALAESLCNAVITPGSAQMARYRRKEGQARDYLTSLAAGTLPEDAAALAEAYPAVVGEVGITAETPWTVAQIIVAMADAWWAYGDAVEQARLAGKRTVEAAGTPEAVAAAEAGIIWPALPA